MTIRVSRPMDYANRFGVQQADQAIKRDIIRALVELITNSDDSYKRLEKRGGYTDGRIIVEITRRRVESVIRVIDFAEGMDGHALDRALGVYAEDTSGFTSGESVRGYFGRGIKDSILGLGSGRVDGLVRRRLHSAWLGLREGKAHYEAQEPMAKPATFLAGLLPGSNFNATVVELTISRPDVRIPQFDNLRTQLSLTFSLRDILTDKHRALYLRNVDQNGNLRQEFKVSYEFPTGQEIKRDTILVPNHNASCQIVLYRSQLPLDTPREAGSQAQAGVLIKGESAIFDNSLFRFDGDIHAQRFYGSVSCLYLDELLRNNEPILTATRDGLDRSHPFVRELFRTCESFLEPFVQEEARKARADEHRVQNERLRQKLSSALTQLNQIAQEELAQLDDDGNQERNTPFVPESGFGFVPEYANVLQARRKTLLVRSLIPQILPEGARVTVTSDNPQVSVLTPQLTIEAKQEFPWVGEAAVVVEGRQVGAEAVLTAESEGLISEALVRVIAREEPGEVRPRRRMGLFNDIKFTDQPDTRQRVRYDRETHDVVIAISHQSVRPYITDVSGGGSDTPQGQVILAELVTEAICGAIARRGVETGRFAAPQGGEVEAIQAQQLRLQNLYAGRIHQVLVDSQFRQT